jgi:hypothetical protein
MADEITLELLFCIFEDVWTHKVRIFFVVHRNSRINMTALLSLVSRKKETIVKRSAKISDGTLEK